MPKKEKIVDIDIYKSGVVANLDFNFWCGATKLKPGDLGLTAIPKDKISLGSKRLVHKEDVDDIFTVRAKAKNFFKQNSFPFPFGGARFIPFARLEKVVSKEIAYEKEWFEKVNAFVEKYPSLRTEMVKEYDKWFEELLQHSQSKEVAATQKAVLLSQLQEKYPTREDLKKSFDFEFTIFEVNSPEFKKISAVETIGKLKKAEDREQIYREKYAKKVDLFLNEVVAGLKTMVLDIVQKLQERIEKDDVKMSSVRSYRKFAEAFRAMDFVDTNVDNAISVLEDKLKDVTKNELDDKAFKEKFMADLDKVKEAATSIDVSKILGKFKRNIRVIEDEKEE